MTFPEIRRHLYVVAFAHKRSSSLVSQWLFCKFPPGDKDMEEQGFQTPENSLRNLFPC